MYFAIGVFPSWAYEWLRRWARGLLKRDVPSDNLSLEYVDGMDDVIIERFEELGIANVQHLATAEPVNLALRTFYPLYRIIDWIDQAILIIHLRKNILSARKLGIRGAIDMSGLYKASLLPPPEMRGRTGLHPETDVLDSGERARSLLQALARMTGGTTTRSTSRPSTTSGRISRTTSMSSCSPTSGITRARQTSAWRTSRSVGARC